MKPRSASNEALLALATARARRPLFRYFHSALKGAVAILGAALLFGACEIRFGEGVGPERSCDSCGRVNALTTCEAGECVIVGCERGFGDCNEWARDGCETDLRESRGHCGVCGNDCALCSNGVCGEPMPIADVGSSGLARLAVDETHVYWCTFDGALWRSPKRSGAAGEQLAFPGVVDALHVDETHLYWVTAQAGPSALSNVLRRRKEGGSSVEQLGVLGNEVWPNHMVPHGEFVYFMPRGSGGALVRVSTTGGGVETLPDLDGEGVISGLRARTNGLVFGYSERPGTSQLIEYLPATGRFETLDAHFMDVSFAVDEEYAYYQDPPREEGVRIQYPLLRRSLETGISEEIGRSTSPYPYMMLDGSSLFLIDFDRGSAFVFDLARRTSRVLFGAQSLLGNVTVDSEFLYYASGGRILRVSR